MSILEEERKFEGSNDNNKSPKNLKSARSQNQSLPDFDNISDSADLAIPMWERKGDHPVP